MCWATRLGHLFRRLLAPNRVEQELHDEVDSYFAILIERGVAQGLSPEEARCAARLKFEGPEQVKQIVREERVGATAETILQDIRYAWRGLTNSPAFTFLAVLTIALGLGVNAAIFSVVDGVMWKSSGYPDAERIVQLWERSPKGSRNTISAANFRDWVQQSDAFESIAARSDGLMSYTGGDQPRSVQAAMVSSSYFNVFGVSAAFGRTFAADEDQPGSQKVVVLSHRFWVSRFAGDRGLIGRSILLNGTPHTVIGVLPGDSPFDRQAVDAWAPLALPAGGARDYNYLTAVAKLKLGVGIEQAQASMNAIAAHIGELYPAARKGWVAVVDSYLESVVGPTMRRSLTVLMLAVAAVLLIACANLSNLLMARATARSREIALRVALGARRARIVRMLLTESLLLSACGALIGIVIGYGLLTGIQFLLPPLYFSSDARIAMDGRVLLFLAAVTILMSLAIGLMPAIQASRHDSAEALKEGGRSSSAGRNATFLRNAFVAGQVAVAFMLLMGAGLLVRSFQAVMNVDIGFESKGVVAVSLPLAVVDNPDVAKLVQYTAQVVEEVRAEPGIVNAAVTNVYPLRGWGFGMRFRLPPEKDEFRVTGFKIVTPGYFQTIGLRLLAGRFLADSDTRSAPWALVVNESFAKRYSPGMSALGKRIFMERLLPNGSGLGPEVAWEIVGIVADEKANGLEDAKNAGAYASFAQSPILPELALLAKGPDDAGKLISSLRRAVDRVNKNQVLDRPMTVDQIKAESVMSRTFPATLLSGFSILAMLLACVGIYGVLSFVTTKRTQEFGLRLALGASPTDLIWMVLGNGAKPVIVGITVGLIGATAFARFMQSMLFGVGPMDAPTLLAVGGLLLAVSLTACFVPAWRAARIDPMSALRQE